MADFSDSTGQFSASCFEESLVESFQRWAAEGTCVLLNVDLDSPNPDEPPRVTIRGARPLSEVKSAARMVLNLDVVRIEALQELALVLESGERGARRSAGAAAHRRWSGAAGAAGPQLQAGRRTGGTAVRDRGAGQRGADRAAWGRSPASGGLDAIAQFRHSVGTGRLVRR
jgi:hypothetical protein